MFRAFRIPAYRIYWTGNFISQMGNWMQNLARQWLVYEITHSTAALGLIAFLNQLPLLFLSLLGGVMADRTDRRRILVFTQTIYMLLAFVLAGLTWTHTAQVWHIAALSLLGGIITAYDLPARQTMVTDMVGRDDLMNAVALNSAGFNIARILGPAVAGFLVDQVGMASCFFLNGLSFLAVIFPLFWLKFEQTPPQREGNVLENMKEGLAYIASNRKLVAIMSIVSVSSLFGLPYATLMPAFAKEVFGTGAAGLGKLFSASGIGALAGALLLARLSRESARETVVLIAGMGLGITLVGFSLSTGLGVAMLFMAFIGLAATTQNATTNTLVQLLVPDRLRGRVMSAYMMIFQGIQPFGNLQAGVVAERLGAPFAVRFGGIVSLIYVAGVAMLFWKRNALAPEPERTPILKPDTPPETVEARRSQRHS